TDLQTRRSSGELVDVTAYLSNQPVYRGEVYQAESLIAVPDAAELRAAGEDYPEWVAEYYLQVPEEITGRTRELARRIAGDLPTPYDKAAAITAWLRSNIEYQRVTEAPPVGVEPIDWFIFEYGIGFCNYYASAEVIMLRSLGVPARMAVGYARGEYDGQQALYSVTAEEYHAWPEVYFPGYGWVEFEPTVSQPPLLRPEPAPELAEQGQGSLRSGFGSRGELDELRLERMSDLLTQDEPLPEQNPAGGAERIDWRRMGLAAAGLLILGFGLWTQLDAGWRLSLERALRLARRKLGPRQPSAQRQEYRPMDSALGRAYLRWLAWWPRLGLPSSSDQTPAERAAIFSRAYPTLAAESSALADYYQQQRFAVAQIESSDWQGHWSALQRGLWRLYIDRLRRRLLGQLAYWRGAPPRLLDNPDPDRAVAHGAVAYGLARRGKGLKIGGGTARSLFLLTESAQREPQAVCLLPRGTEEGRELRLKQRRFALRLNQPVRFHLASASDGRRYRAGELVTPDEAFAPLPPLATVIEGSGGEVPVELASRLTEVGTLAVDCVAADNPARRWRLEFQLRDSAPRVETPVRLPPRFDEAAALIRQYYGGRSGRVDPRGIKTLRNDLEKLLGRRESWDTPLLRELFAVLLDGANRRRRSADHERLCCNLAGYCLRPGYGYPLDDWRIDQLWPLYDEGVQYVKDAQVWSEWWTLWRRVAGGLDAAAQQHLLEGMTPYLLPPTRQVKLKGVRKLGVDDMVRLAASLEHLPATRKVELGGWLLERLRHRGESVQTWLAVGRLGTRVPLYGSAHNVVPRETAADWLETVLALDWKKIQPAAFAAVSLARMSGDRERDLDQALREQVATRLRAIKASDHWIRMVREVTDLDEADQKRLYGDSLPVGLKLVG
ncbi:MAG: transglutaminase domain-containing protein, partial [Candidatus Competibacterales bacterium]|nr:transglutaminase domain-containing protein [Candidatus Competibacterales bacterium]